MCNERILQDWRYYPCQAPVTFLPWARSHAVQVAGPHRRCRRHKWPALQPRIARPPRPIIAAQQPQLVRSTAHQTLLRAKTTDVAAAFASAAGAAAAATAAGRPAVAWRISTRVLAWHMQVRGSQHHAHTITYHSAASSACKQLLTRAVLPSLPPFLPPLHGACSRQPYFDLKAMSTEVTGRAGEVMHLKNVRAAGTPREGQVTAE